MERIKWIGLFLLAVILVSCNPENREDNFVSNPATLEELFRGFNEAELSPVYPDLNKEPILIVATGHLYGLLKFPEVYDAFVEEVIKQKPDYYFLLGDLVYNNTDNEWDTVFARISQINAKTYFAPGNHDLNYHYERYEGIRDNQIEAEMRYLDQVGYRYKLVQDGLANYVFINANDSAHRILSFINRIKPQIDTNKHMILISSQSLWHNVQQDPNDSHTWVRRPFHREELLQHVENFQFLIHGDWGGDFYRGNYGKFDVMAVGNRNVGDSLFIARIEIYKDTVIAKPVFINIPESCSWFKQQ